MHCRRVSKRSRTSVFFLSERLLIWMNELVAWLGIDGFLSPLFVYGLLLTAFVRTMRWLCRTWIILPSMRSR
jgi:hypothetical protein